VTVLRRTAGGGRIVGVGDARVAIGRGVLLRVQAEPLPPARPDPLTPAPVRESALTQGGGAVG
jgi:hypothetical protein